MPSTPARISVSQLEQSLRELPGWTVIEDKLHREYRFADFKTAMSFMMRVAFEAERLDHHPNWSNVYRQVDVQLWSHDVGGLTERDIELARAMEQCARPLVDSD